MSAETPLLHGGIPLEFSAWLPFTDAAITTFLGEDARRPGVFVLAYTRVGRNSQYLHVGSDETNIRAGLLQALNTPSLARWSPGASFAYCPMDADAIPAVVERLRKQLIGPHA